MWSCVRLLLYVNLGLSQSYYYLFVSMYAFPVGMIECLILLCLCRVLISSAYVVSFTGARGVGVPDVDKLNRVGNSTTPCGIPVLFLNARCPFM